MPTRKKDLKKFAASRAHVWTRCPKSETLARKQNQITVRISPEQEQGVILHKAIAENLSSFSNVVAANTLTDAERDALQNIPDYESIIEFARNAMQLIVERIKSENGNDYAIYIESTFDVTLKDYHFSARPDILIFGAKTKEIVVIDVKTGFLPVAAENNEQLRVYAHAFLHTENRDVGKHSAKAIIIQPRLQTIDYGNIRLTKDFFLLLKQKIESQKQFVVGAHCKNCVAIGKCVAFRDAVMEYYRPENRDNLLSQPEELAKLVALAKPVGKFFDAILAEAKEFLEFGGKIPGVALVTSAGRRTWQKDIDVEDVAKVLEISPDDMYDVSVKSPAAVEKLIDPEYKTTLKQFVFQPQTTTLVVRSPAGFLSDGETQDDSETGIIVHTALDDVLRGSYGAKKPKVKRSK